MLVWKCIGFLNKKNKKIIANLFQAIALSTAQQHQL